MKYNLFLIVSLVSIISMYIYYLHLVKDNKPFHSLISNTTITTISSTPVVAHLAIIQMTNEKTVKKVAESIRNKKEYCLKHNYTLIEDEPSG